MRQHLLALTVTRKPSAMLFIDNKYTKWYFQIIQSAKQEVYNCYTEKHHIIPKSLGGSNDSSNIVSLTAKQHFICHMLLTKMVLGKQKQKMVHAWWAMSTLKKDCQHRYRLNSIQYKLVRESYIKQFIKNNPMKDKKQKLRMKEKNNNPAVRSLKIDGIEFVSQASACRYFNTTPWYLKKNYNIEYTDNKKIINRNIFYTDKFITPIGIFKTKKEIQNSLQIPEWTLKTIYNNLDALPINNGRKSKKIKHLNIDYNKTWRENGFDII